jgi:hypothetical protein
MSKIFSSSHTPQKLSPTPYYKVSPCFLLQRGTVSGAEVTVWTLFLQNYVGLFSYQCKSVKVVGTGKEVEVWRRLTNSMIQDSETCQKCKLNCMEICFYLPSRVYLVKSSEKLFLVIGIFNYRSWSKNKNLTKLVFERIRIVLFRALLSGSCLRINTHTHTHIYIYIHTYMCARAYVCIHIYIYIYVQMGNNEDIPCRYVGLQNGLLEERKRRK